MTRAVRFIQNYLIWALPFVLACMVWGTIHPEKDILINASLFTRATWEVLSWNLMLWFAILIVFLVLLVVLPEAREKTLRRLANLKERDEREQLITGRASRAAYISTLSLLVLLLFFSIFSLNIYRIPETEAINGKTGTVTIGLGFSLLDRPKMKATAESKVIFESRDIPLSKTAIILTLIIWQLAVFNLAARKENLRDIRE
jgi:hypothetical protein